MPADPPLAIPDWVAYDLHGRWVRHKTEGYTGRIGYHHRDRSFAAVVWEDHKPTPLPLGYPDALASWYPMSDLELIDRDPTPWYDFEAIKRRRRPPSGA